MMVVTVGAPPPEAVASPLDSGQRTQSNQVDKNAIFYLSVSVSSVAMVLRGNVDGGC